MSTRKGKDFHAEEDALDGGLEFHDEVEPIDPWGDILHDGRIKYRTLADAWEEFKQTTKRGIHEERKRQTHGGAQKSGLGEGATNDSAFEADTCKERQ